MGRFSAQKVTHKRVEDLRGLKCTSSPLKYDKWWNKECVCVYTHTQRGEVKQGSDECARRRCKKWELYFPFSLDSLPPRSKKLHLLVCCVDLHCACTHLMTPLTPRLEVKQSGYTIHYSTCEYPQRESLHRKKTIKKKETMKNWKKNPQKKEENTLEVCHMLTL